MNIRYWLPLLCLVVLPGCGSRQLHSPSPFEKNNFTNLASNRVLLAQTEKPSEPGPEDLETFEDPFAEDSELDDLEAEQQAIADPLEPVNRAFFHFNDKLYFWVLKPVASGYRAVVPEPIRLNVRNFFTNLVAPVRLVNCLLQANIPGAAVELSRFTVNSILGIGGLFDVGRALKLPNQDEDLGQTFGVWGLGPGLYLNLPFFGPSSLRDGVGRVGDAFVNPVGFVNIGILPAIGVNALEQVNKTSLAIGDYEALKEMALDPYVAVRNAYFQFRRSKIQERFRSTTEAPSPSPGSKAFE
jgi:phospholipid-binding lipoprotein MlaA